MYTVCSYVADSDEALNLVEGEKVYVIGKLFKIQQFRFMFQIHHFLQNDIITIGGLSKSN
jgi:hypothetical protein